MLVLLLNYFYGADEQILKNVPEEFQIDLSIFFLEQNSNCYRILSDWAHFNESPGNTKQIEFYFWPHMASENLP
jgi:hypothetical protein